MTDRPTTVQLMGIVDRVLHDMGKPHPKESRQFLRDFLQASWNTRTEAAVAGQGGGGTVTATASPVRIRPLVWKEIGLDGGYFYANTPFGQYSIEMDNTESTQDWLVKFPNDGPYGWSGGSRGTKEAAGKVCCNHYETRILAALEPTPSGWRDISTAPHNGKDMWLGWKPFPNGGGVVPRRGHWDIGTNQWVAHWEDRGLPVGFTPIPFDPQPDYFCLGFEPSPPSTNQVDDGDQPDTNIKQAARVLLDEYTPRTVPWYVLKPLEDVISGTADMTTPDVVRAMLRAIVEGE